jgi:hypothetical protein
MKFRTAVISENTAVMCGEHSGHLGDDSKKQQSDPLRAA